MASIKPFIMAYDPFYYSCVNFIFNSMFSWQKLLPTLLLYHVCKMNQAPPTSSGREACFTATLRLPCSNEEEVLTWIREFQRLSYTTWRVEDIPQIGKTHTVQGEIYNTWLLSPFSMVKRIIRQVN